MHMISRDWDHSEGWAVGVNCRLEPFQKFIRFGNVTHPLDCYDYNFEITILYQLHAQKALLQIPKICNIYHNTPNVHKHNAKVPFSPKLLLSMILP